MFDLAVLGDPTILRWHGQRVDLRPMERVVILALLCAKGHSLTALKLARQLYPDDQRQGAARTTASHTAHIRKALRAAVGHDQALVSDRVRGGVAYRLDIVSDCIDAHRFERQVAAGCREFQRGLHEEAVTTLEAALNLWRGAPLSDAADWPFAITEIARLENLHRAASITLMETRIRVGRYREVVGELAGMAAARPGDGKVWHLLIMSLYRSERDAEAGAACQDGIRAFRGLGLDTSRLEALQREVLTGSLPR
jgi:DNA-binding SARP family transcriptional activator